MTARTIKIQVLLVMLILAGPAWGCLWDSDTIEDEMQLRASVYDLITGQFAHHGDAYYTARMKRLEAKGQLSKFEWNELAVAYVRLKQFEKARGILLKLNGDYPDDYTTLSNLGVLEKKTGHFKLAAEYIAKALTIKPEGHMGLGDWYLKSISWSAKHVKHVNNPEVTEATHNFLGEEYAKFRAYSMGKKELSAEQQKRYEHLKNLLRNDQSFADGCLVMGDFLNQLGDKHLAFVAYARALKLNHPNAEMVKGRMKSLTEHWKGGELSAAQFTTLEKTNKYFAGAEKWLNEFKQVEASLLVENPDPTFDDVFKAMKEQKKPQPARGGMGDVANPWWLTLLVVPGVLFLMCRCWRGEAKSQ